METLKRVAIVAGVFYGGTLLFVPLIQGTIGDDGKATTMTTVLGIGRYVATAFVAVKLVGMV